MVDSAFITGGSGLFGVGCAMALRDRCRVTLGLHARQVVLAGVRSHQCHLDTVDQVRQVLDAVQPSVVVHAAGMTNIEACEADPALAEHVNVALSANVATACAAARVPLVHISTDHLFRGDRALVSEEAPVAPLNVYARTKAAAEVAVLEAYPEALVARTNFYGWGPGYRPSFSDRVINALRANTAITLFTDVFYTPILSTELARAVIDLVETKSSGVVHIVGDERISKYDFGVRLAGRFGLEAALIARGTIAGRPELVTRPREMSLSNAKACTILGRPLGSIDEHLTLLRRQEETGMTGEVRSL